MRTARKRETECERGRIKMRKGRKRGRERENGEKNGGVRRREKAFRMKGDERNPRDALINTDDT